MKSERYEKGLETFKKLMGEGAGKDIVNAFADICPDMERFTMEWAFNDIYNRPGLDLKTREIITVSSLITQGCVLPQLKAHIEAALNAGVSKTEMVELIIQLGLYCGVPRVINALFVARDVFKERGL